MPTDNELHKKHRLWSYRRAKRRHRELKRLLHARARRRGRARRKRPRRTTTRDITNLLLAQLLQQVKIGPKPKDPTPPVNVIH